MELPDACDDDPLRLPHKHTDAEERFPRAFACQAHDDEDLDEDDTLETSGDELGSSLDPTHVASRRRIAEQNRALQRTSSCAIHSSKKQGTTNTSRTSPTTSYLYLFCEVPAKGTYLLIDDLQPQLS